MRKITPLKQPHGSTLCGQACVAMALGITLEESIKRFGHGHSTRTKEVAKVLREGGLECPDRLVRIKRDAEFPPCCIIKLTFKVGRMGHWVLLWNSELFDPDVGPRGRITSYLPINVAALKDFGDGSDKK